jgi:hypothetical protein
VIYRFGDLGVFQAQVEAELERQDKEEQEIRAYKIERYMRMADRGELPKYEDGDLDELIRIGAQRLVVGRCLPNLSDAEALRLTLRSSRNFVKAMLRLNSEIPENRANLSLTAGYIETVALEFGVYDDIWPIDDTAALRVTIKGKVRSQYVPGAYRTARSESK